MDGVYKQKYLKMLRHLLLWLQCLYCAMNWNDYILRCFITIIKIQVASVDHSMEEAHGTHSKNMLANSVVREFWILYDTSLIRYQEIHPTFNNIVTRLTSVLVQSLKRKPYICHVYLIQWHCGNSKYVHENPLGLHIMAEK